MEAEAPQPAPAKAKATKAASLLRTRETLPTTILESATWDEFTEKELLKGMMGSISAFTAKVIEWAGILGKSSEVTVGDRSLRRKDIAVFRKMLQDELAKVPAVIELNRAVNEAPYKTPMGLCFVARPLIEFFEGDGKTFGPVELGPAYEINYSPIEVKLMEKIGRRRQVVMRQRYVKAGGDKDRPQESFVPPFDIPRSSESTEHIFTRLDKTVLEMVNLRSECSTAPTISALLSLYFRSFGRNVRMPPKVGGAAGAPRETPKIMFDARMKAFFGEVVSEEGPEAKRKKGSKTLFSEEDMTERGIGYLQVIQRIVSRFTMKRKDLRDPAQIDRYDELEGDKAFMEQVQDGARAAIETKRYYKEVTERENRGKARQ